MSAAPKKITEEKSASIGTADAAQLKSALNEVKKLAEGNSELMLSLQQVLEGVATKLDLFLNLNAHSGAVLVAPARVAVPPKASKMNISSYWKEIWNKSPEEAVALVGLDASIIKKTKAENKDALDKKKKPEEKNSTLCRKVYDKLSDAHKGKLRGALASEKERREVQAKMSSGLVPDAVEPEAEAEEDEEAEE